MLNRRGRGSDKALTRRRFLDAAADVFAERGFHDATLEQIAERAGFTRGAFYSNFKSKDELFVAMIDDQNAADAASTLAAIRKGVTPLDVVLGDPMPPEKRRHLDIVRLEFMLYCARRPELWDQIRKVRERRRDAIADQAASVAGSMGVKLSIDVEDAADLILAVNSELALMRLTDLEDAPRRASFFGALFRLMGLTPTSRKRRRSRPGSQRQRSTT